MSIWLQNITPYPICPVLVTTLFAVVFSHREYKMTMIRIMLTRLIDCILSRSIFFFSVHIIYKRLLKDGKNVTLKMIVACSQSFEVYLWQFPQTGLKPLHKVLTNQMISKWLCNSKDNTTNSTYKQAYATFGMFKIAILIVGLKESWKAAVYWEKKPQDYIIDTQLKTPLYRPRSFWVETNRLLRKSEVQEKSKHQKKTMQSGLQKQEQNRKQ